MNLSLPIQWSTVVVLRSLHMYTPKMGASVTPWHSFQRLATGQTCTFSVDQQFKPLMPWLIKVLLPLWCLLSPKAEFCCKPAYQEAFTSPIKKLTSLHVLITTMVRVACGLKQIQHSPLASEWPCGKNLSDAKTWRLQPCGSCSTWEVEMRHLATEIKLIAAVWAWKRMLLFLLGNQLEVIVDHAPLILIISKILAIHELLFPTIVQLKEKLISYNITGLLCADTHQGIVDCLSQNPVNSPNSDDLHG